jgi:hypothetical protein
VGKVKFSISATSFTNDLEKCPGGNVYRTVIRFMQCKTVELKYIHFHVMRKHSMLLWFYRTAAIY